ncbi:hypothetical protein Q7269_07210 [Glaesserella parasuis]|nr:hypothetical protein [Glaesserella parasuis]MDP0313730.1 hypothetical protein [Glaesserella parasuis]
MLNKIQGIFDADALLGQSTAEKILNSSDPIQSFILCHRPNNSRLKAAIATKIALANISEKFQSIIDINLDYVDSAELHLENVFSKIGSLKTKFSVIYLEATDLQFLNNQNIINMIYNLSKTIRKFNMKLVISLPISDKTNLIGYKFNLENFIFITFEQE